MASVMNLERARESTDDAAEVAVRVERARAAQRGIAHYSQQQVDQLIRGMVWSCSRPGVAEALARHALEETQLGDYAGKFAKMNYKTRAALMDIIDDISVGIIEQDAERNLVKIAKPVGVIGALAPSTNPEATPIIKAINAVKARNAIIVAPHPRAKLTNKLIVDRMRDAIERLGAPADLVQDIGDVSLARTNELMKQCDLIWATGGAGMVKAAYSSGTPALGVGAGNAVITVDETANLDEAAEKIRVSKTLDLAASCSADNSVLAVDAIYDDLVDKLVAEGGHVAAPGDYEKIAAVLWKDGVLNTQAVVKKPQVLCQMAGVEIPEDRLFIIMPEDGVGPEHPYSGEKLSAIIALYRVGNIDEAVDLTNEIQEYQGKGHSCGIYSYSDENIMKLGFGCQTARLLVNQPQAPSNSGNLWNGLRQTFSLGCGTWGNTSTDENLYWRHLVNVTWVSKPLATPKVIPDDKELFGEVMDQLA